MMILQSLDDLLTEHGWRIVAENQDGEFVAFLYADTALELPIVYGAGESLEDAIDALRHWVEEDTIQTKVQEAIGEGV